MWVNETLIQLYDFGSDELTSLFSLRQLDANRAFNQHCCRKLPTSIQLTATVISLKTVPSIWQITEDPDAKKEKNEEYIVEFRVTIVDPEYSKLLRDPDGLQHNDIKEELTAKVTFILRGLGDTVVVFWEMTLIAFIVKLAPN